MRYSVVHNYFCDKHVISVSIDGCLATFQFLVVQARESRKKALEEMSEETKAAFQSIKFYKFYPGPTPDTPDVSNFKVKSLSSSIFFFLAFQ